MISVSKVLLTAAASLVVAAALPLAAHSETTKDRVLKEGRITIGIFNQAPWGFKTESGEVSGVHPDMVKAVLGPAGIKKVDFVVVEWGALIPSLVSGRMDAIATGLGITPVRCEQVAFSDPDIAVIDAVLVKKGNPAKIHSYADIAANPKLQLGTNRGSTSAENAIKAGVKKEQIQGFPDIPSQVSAVLSGRVDAVANSATTTNNILADPKVAGLERAMPFTGYTVNGHEFAIYTAVAFRPEDAALRDLYNENLKKRKADGTIEKILAKYGFSAAENAPPSVTAKDVCGDKYH